MHPYPEWCVPSQPRAGSSLLLAQPGRCPPCRAGTITAGPSTSTAGWCNGSQQPRDGVRPPTWGEEPSRGPTPGAILGMSFDEVLCSSRLDQTGCFLGGAGRTQRETRLCRQSQGDPALAPNPSLQPLSHLMSQSCSEAESQPLF